MNMISEYNKNIEEARLNLFATIINNNNNHTVLSTVNDAIDGLSQYDLLSNVDIDLEFAIQDLKKAKDAYTDFLHFIDQAQRNLKNAGF